MSLRKELGSKQKKKIISLVFAPGVSQKIIKDSLQFLMEGGKKGLNYLFDKQQQIVFFSHEGIYLPSLKFIRMHPELTFPKVQVDEGAVNFVINGADVFTQGIVGADQDFPGDTIVSIVNPQNAVLCLGKSLLSSHDLLTQKGKGIQNIHYLGDFIWNENIK